MAFGNPYGEMWKWEDVDFWAQRFSEIGVKDILLSDTTEWQRRKPFLFVRKNSFKIS
jgi:hypothetical protein